MKQLIFIVCACSGFYGHAQGTETVQVKTNAKSVILYLDGAEIHQSKQVNLNAGRTAVVFTGLSAKLIPKSIQVEVPGDVTVLSVSDKLNFLSETRETPRRKQLKDSIELINDNIAQLNWQTEAFSQEKGMLSKNESIGGHDKGVSIAELKLAADFYRVRLKEINGELFALQKKREKQNEILAKLQRQLAENGDVVMPSAEITVLLSSQAKANANIELKYVVKESGWTPSYDLLSEDVSKPIILKYRAKVYNNSGVDWNDVKIKLSTADPMKSAAKPQLLPWYLNFSNPAANFYNYNNYQNDKSNVYNPQQQSAPSRDISLYEQEISSPGKGKNEAQLKSIQYEEVQVSELSAEFDIKQNYSVPADAKPYLVDVITYSLNASFQYYSVPKLEKEAFMLAKITGWEDLDLVEGPANVFLAGTFVGQSYIYTRSVEDTLSLSFGRDKKIVVTRTKLKDFNSERSMGSTRKVTYSYEIVVKNNHKAPIQIEVEDQLPVSQNSEIVVDPIKLSDAEHNVLSGQLKWKLSLNPDETRKLILTFSVRYPKNKSVELQKMRAKTRAKF